MTQQSPEDPRPDLVEFLLDCHPDPEIIRKELESRTETRDEIESARNYVQILRDAMIDTPVALPEFPAAPPRRPWRMFSRIAAALILTVVGVFGIPVGVAWRHYIAAESALRVKVTGPESLPEGIPVEYTIETHTQKGVLTPAELSWRLVGTRGEVLREGHFSSHGRAMLKVPAGLDAARRLEIRADSENDTRTTTLELRRGLTRWIHHISTCKPVYRPGETLRFRVVSLDRQDHSAAEGLPLSIRLVDARETILRQIRQASREGIVAGEYQLPDDLPQGTYSLRVLDAEERLIVEELVFRVLEYRQVVFEIEESMDRESCPPGETLVVKLKVRERGETPVDAGYQFTTWLNEKTLSNGSGQLDASGLVRVEIPIPPDAASGSGRLVFAVESRGRRETRIVPFRVEGRGPHLMFFPEGGDLLAGYRQRVYYEARDELDRPVDFRGTLRTSNGNPVLHLERSVSGRGRFEITPAIHEKLELHFDDLSAAPVTLPPARAEGVLVRSLADSYPSGSPLEFQVSVSEPTRYTAALFCRGTVVATRPVEGRGTHKVSFDLDPAIAGVLRLTLFDQNLLPVAERLIHRGATSRLKIQTAWTRDLSSIGTPRELNIDVRNTDGSPLKALLGVRVYDATLDSLAGTPRVGFWSQVNLGCDVDLGDNSQTFDTESAAGRFAIDLLLGTRGWRRFAWHDPERLQAEDPGRQRRVALAEGRAEILRQSFAGPDTARTLGMTRRTLNRAVQSLGAASALVVFLLLLIALAITFVSGGAGSRSRRVSIVLITLLTFGVFLTIYRLSQDSVDFGRADKLAPGAPVLSRGQEEVAEAEEKWDADLVFEEYVESSPENEVAGTTGIEDSMTPEIPVETPPPGRTKSAVYTREYAFDFEDSTAGRRETNVLYWHPDLRSDANGRATVRFDTSERLTRWRVIVEAHDGRHIGEVETELTTRSDLEVFFEPPRHVMTGDQIRLRVAVNCPLSDVSEVDIQLKGSGVHIDETESQRLVLKNGVGEMFVDLDFRGSQGESTLEIVVSGRELRRELSRMITVHPRGFAERVTIADVLRGTSQKVVYLPGKDSEHPPEGRLTLHLSPEADIDAALGGLFREPHGCFEQASAQHYPNVVRARHLAHRNQPVPADLQEILTRGYTLLRSFECRGLGYEWFGADPGHETLTAYGLLEFSETARFVRVDQEMLGRTRRWLLSRRSGDGTFHLNPQHLDEFGGAPAETSNVYITYALMESGEDPATLRKEVDYAKRLALESTDPYVQALATAAIRSIADPEILAAARRRLMAAQRSDGGFSGRSSITSSEGLDRDVETTALAILALGDHDTVMAPRRAALDFLLRSRRHGSFGGTQATVLALKALLDQRTTAAFRGPIKAEINTQTVLDTQLEGRHHLVVEASELASSWKEGANTIELSGPEDAPIPFSLDFEWRSTRPPASPDARLVLDVSGPASPLTLGDRVPIRVAIENPTDRPTGMVLAILGTCSGVEIPHRVLEDLVANRTIDYWEKRGLELALYFRNLPAREVRLIVFDGIAAFAGRFESPVHQLRRYYTPEDRVFAVPLVIEVR